MSKSKDKSYNEPTPRINKFNIKNKEENSRSLISCKSQTNIRGFNPESLENSINTPLSPAGKKKKFAQKARFDSFEILRLLGSGTFGKVFLVKKKDDSKIYAMKVLKKKDLIFKKHLKYAVTESNILKKCQHPFILRIHYTFQVNFLKYFLFFFADSKKFLFGDRLLPRRFISWTKQADDIQRRHC